MEYKILLLLCRLTVNQNFFLYEKKKRILFVQESETFPKSNISNEKLLESALGKENNFGVNLFGDILLQKMMKIYLS